MSSGDRQNDIKWRREQIARAYDKVPPRDFTRNPEFLKLSDDEILGLEFSAFMTLRNTLHVVAETIENRKLPALYDLAAISAYYDHPHKVATAERAVKALVACPGIDFKLHDHSVNVFIPDSAYPMIKKMSIKFNSTVQANGRSGTIQFDGSVIFRPDKDCPDGLKTIGNKTAIVKETIGRNNFLSEHAITAICIIVLRSLGCCNRIAQCFDIEFLE